MCVYVHVSMYECVYVKKYVRNWGRDRERHDVVYSFSVADDVGNGETTRLQACGGGRLPAATYYYKHSPLFSRQGRSPTEENISVADGTVSDETADLELLEAEELNVATN